MKPKRLVSIDIGNTMARVKSSTQTWIDDSAVAVEQGAIRFDGFDTSRHTVIEFEGQRLAVGRSAYKLGRMTIRDMGSHRLEGTAYRQLFAAGLTQTVRRSTDLSVIASLPIHLYMGQRDFQRRKLSGLYDVTFDGSRYIYQIDPDNMHIVPEGFGGICCLLLNRNGTVADSSLADMRVGVVDAGGRTVDFLFFDHMELVPTLSWGVDKVGMTTLWEFLGEIIQRKYNRSLSVAELDTALHDGYFMRADSKIQITDDVYSASEQLANAVISEINSHWDGGYAANMLLFVGGGSQFIFNRMPYSHAKLVNEHEHGVPAYLANLEGAYRFATYRDFADG